MNKRKLMLMAGALAFALLCATLARSLFGGGGSSAASAATPAPSNGTEVLVATRTLPVGTIVTADAFRYQPWPDNLIDKAYFLKGKEDQQTLLGTVVRYPITAGQPVTQGAIVKPGDRGFLAAALGQGMRAVTFVVTAQNGVAGFVFPGDRVDLLLTQTVAGSTAGATALKASETIVSNLRVLATDQRTDKTTDSDGKTVVATFSNVTIEATPKIAERIAVAQQIGTLSLALRPIADDKMELERQIANGDINVPTGGDSRAEKQMLLQLAARPVDADSFTTGAEVSRFQRGSYSGNQQAPATPAPASPSPVQPPRPRGPVVTVMRGQSVTQASLGGM